jgi:hypothetical protein
MIGPDGLLLLVPTYMQFQLQFYGWGLPGRKKQAKLFRYLILLSRVTCWAPVDMLSGDDGCVDLEKGTTPKYRVTLRLHKPLYAY